jgi:hypothetical protein
VDPLLGGPRAGRLLQIVAFVASAALAAGVIRFAFREPLVTAGLLSGALTFAVLRWISRRRVRALLLSGDVRSVLERWSPSLARVPHPATMAPLMTATAFAAYGWIRQARAAMESAERGPAWEAALEHRLFLDVLLLAFEGDREGSLEKAGRLERLPLPPTGAAIRGRVLTLRRAVGALARAFAHRAEPGDRALLEQASEASPLVFWAMRYAAAVIAIDEGDPGHARVLLAKAPSWPTESTFRAFHDEILHHAPPSA